MNKVLQKVTILGKKKGKKCVDSLQLEGRARRAGRKALRAGRKEPGTRTGTGTGTKKGKGQGDGAGGRAQ